MIMLVPTTRSDRTSSSTNRYSRLNGSLIFPVKLRTDLSMSPSKISSLSGRLTLLRTEARRFNPDRSDFCTSRSTSMGGAYTASQSNRYQQRWADMGDCSVTRHLSEGGLETWRLEHQASE